jgi:cobaltochelatase CobT
MASNYKAKSGPKESPTEPFKRAVTGCLRALAKKPELEISFAAERPGLAGGKVRLPEPARKLTKTEAAIVRGHADSAALRLACHDPAVHRKLAPGGQQARAVFEAVEQARVEAIGARRMSGVAKNLTAMLDDRFHRGKFDDITDRADAPIEEAIAMMVRERLTGQAPPPAARKLVDLWRPVIESKAGRGLDSLENLIEDQRKFGDAVHDLLDSLEMGEDRDSEADEDENDDKEQEGQKDESGEQGDSSDSDELQRLSMEELEASRRMPILNLPTPLPPKCPMTARWATRIVRQSRGALARMAATICAARTTSRSSRNSTRRSKPRISASRKNSTGFAATSTSSCLIFRASWRASPIGCSAN